MALANIVVALDGSETADRALSYALALARRESSALLLCCVVDRAGALAECAGMSTGADLYVPIVAALDDTANTTLRRAAARVAAAGIDVSSTLLDGQAAHAIDAFARDRHADAIVMGTQGKRGLDRLFLGSTAAGVLRRTDISVFVVPARVPAGEPVFDRILVAIDESDPSDAAAAFARAFAAAGADRLVFCRVAESLEAVRSAATCGYDPAPMIAELRATAASFLAAQAERARAAGLASDCVVVDGEPAEQILIAAHAQAAGLIVIGTHGRRGLQRLFLGSVAEDVVRRSSIPVAVVRASRSDATRHARPLATSAMRA